MQHPFHLMPDMMVGDFRIQARLGAGGFGAVFRVERDGSLGCSTWVRTHRYRKLWRPSGFASSSSTAGDNSRPGAFLGGTASAPAVAAAANSIRTEKNSARRLEYIRPPWRNEVVGFMYGCLRLLKHTSKPQASISRFSAAWRASSCDFRLKLALPDESEAIGSAGTRGYRGCGSARSCAPGGW